MEHYPATLLDDATLEQLISLERELRQDRANLLAARREAARAVRDGAELTFADAPEGGGGSAGSGEVAETPAEPPADLTHRRVELATPATAENARAALASGADVWVADLEDMLTPTRERLLEAQRTIREVAATRTGDPAPGVPTLMVRPRGLHLDEADLVVDDERASAALVDTVTFLALSGPVLLDRGSGPYLYLPKLETAAEAAWWHRLLSGAEEALGLPLGSTRVSVLVETVQAVYELDGIVAALAGRATGLTAGRWDYVFSFLRTYGHRADQVLPWRDAFTMNTRFLRVYAGQVLAAAQRHGLQAIGGPIGLAPATPFDESGSMTQARVRRDKAREAREGFHGAWVLHPALVPVAREPFEDRERGLLSAEEPQEPGRDLAEQLRDVSVVPGDATLSGVKTALRSSLVYLLGWMRGEGTCTLEGHVEDFGTVELLRMQLWQWLHHEIRLAEGPTMNTLLLDRMLEDEVALARRSGAPEELLERVVTLLREAVVAEEPPAFLSQQAYEVLLALPEPALLEGADGGDEQGSGGITA